MGGRKRRRRRGRELGRGAASGGIRPTAGRVAEWGEADFHVLRHRGPDAGAAASGRRSAAPAAGTGRRRAGRAAGPAGRRPPPALRAARAIAPTTQITKKMPSGISFSQGTSPASLRNGGKVGHVISGPALSPGGYRPAGPPQARRPAQRHRRAEDLAQHELLPQRLRLVEVGGQARRKKSIACRIRQAPPTPRSRRRLAQRARGGRARRPPSHPAASPASRPSGAGAAEPPAQPVRPASPAVRSLELFPGLLLFPQEPGLFRLLQLARGTAGLGAPVHQQLDEEVNQLFHDTPMAR